MYLAELFILADKYEDKGFDTNSFKLKIKKLTSCNNLSMRTVEYKLEGTFVAEEGNGNGYGIGEF